VPSETIQTHVHRRRFGDFELVSLSDGFFRLDGGAMFGVIPKPLWEKRIPADERNRIRLGLRPLLVRTPEGSVLVDTGIGDKYDEKAIEIYAIEHPPTLQGSLAAAGVDAAEIRFVVNTHLHFDHAGGNTVAAEGGSVRPAFPRATYLIQEKEWHAALFPGERSRASYRAENAVPLEEAGIVERVAGKTDPLPGITLVPTPGHTGGHQSVVIESKGEWAVYFGDTIPTIAHLDPAWVMAYDLFPQETVERKKALLETAVRRHGLVIFEHDPVTPWGRIEKSEKGFRWVEA
jgi:glyoxylase-like metal-dependent hydrolase (beta-lactamase superfamily II)